MARMLQDSNCGLCATVDGFFSFLLLAQGHPGGAGGGQGERDGELYGAGQLLPPAPLPHVCRGQQASTLFNLKFPTGFELHNA